MNKISFIIPAYNCEKYIDDCIRSVVLQDCKYMFEMIIVNDGSTDTTEDHILKFAQTYSNIKYIFQKNSGATVARNRGIQEATGDWFIFLDSDDLLEDSFLSKINFEEIEEKNCDFVIGNHRKIDEKGVILENALEYSNKIFLEGDDIYKLCVNDPKPGSKIYRASVIRKNNLFFDLLEIGQDANFFIKYLAVCSKVMTINEFFYRYRIVKGSISHTYTLKNLKIIDTFSKIKEFYSSYCMDDVYRNYIVYAEAQHYYFQFCKLRLYKNINDRKIIYYVFKKKFQQLQLSKKVSFSLKNRKYLNKMRLRLRFGTVFTSTLNRYLYLFVKGLMRHV